MILRLLLFTIVTSFANAFAQDEVPEVPAAETDLIINMIRIPEGTGDVYISVYRPEDDWLKQPAYKNYQLPGADINEERSISTTISLPQGTYALSIYFDENGNGELDTGGLFSIPREPVGMSNNHRPTFGPPRFSRADFELGEEPVTQEIELK